VTTSDQTPGRFAATRRHRGAALLCACLAGLPMLPVLAMQPTTGTAAHGPAMGGPAAAHPATALSAPAAPLANAAALPVVAPAQATTVGTAPVVAPPRSAHDAVVVLDQPMPMSDRALLLASDINRLIGKPSAAPAAGAADASTGSRIQNVLQRALTLLGTPYRWGGTTTDGFDCSGLVGYVFRTTLGIELPRVSRDMARSGREVDRDSMVPGDLVFFGRKGRVNHVGIYLGDGRFLHAPRTGRDVTVSKLDGYWGRKFLEARRVAGT
jgi:cell wall-associated NlpC family hydrolase